MPRKSRSRINKKHALERSQPVKSALDREVAEFHASQTKPLQGQAHMPFVHPMFPQIKVDLSGADGNVFNILAACTKEAKIAGLRQDVINDFFVEALSGDYDHAIQTCMKWFDVS
jgi:hypothetical protein